MKQAILQALQEDRTIDITTTGRKTGLPRRIEIWFHNLGGRLFITGTPGSRSWYANLVANPEFTFHLKKSLTADLPARAQPILDRTERRVVLSAIVQKLDRAVDLDDWVASSPLVEVHLDLIDGEGEEE